MDNQVFNGNEWQHVLAVYDCDNAHHDQSEDITLLDQNNLVKATESPKASNIEDYDQFFN